MFCRLIDGRRIKAVLVADAAGATAWLARSQVTIEEGMGGKLRITMPAWLAEEKGLKASAGQGQGSFF